MVYGKYDIPGFGGYESVRAIFDNGEVEIYGKDALVFSDWDTGCIISDLEKDGYTCDASAPGSLKESCAYSGDGEFPYYVFVEKKLTEWLSEIVTIRLKEEEAEKYREWVEKLTN